MIQKEITALVPEKKNSDGEVTQQSLGPVTVLVNYPETLEEAKGWSGDEAILSNAFAHFKVSPIQSGIRALLKLGKGSEEIQESLGTMVMGVAREGGKVDVQAAFVAKFQMATPEAQAEMLDMLRTAAE